MLTADALLEHLRQETTSLPFAPLPLHYIAIAKLLLEHAADDIPHASRVRALLKDLREARQSKVLAGLEMINPTHLEMTNISSMEICELRPFFKTALTQLHALQLPNPENTQPASSQMQESNVQPDDDDHIAIRQS